MRIMIDPGHGGSFPGAVGKAGIAEKHVALAVALQLAGCLCQQPDTIIGFTRSRDEHLAPLLVDDLQARCQAANVWRADLFVSLHCNSFSNPMAAGYEVWTNPQADAADKLAALIWYQIRTDFPEMKGRADFSDGDPDKESKFVVLVGTTMPAVLIEMAFLSNVEDERRLLDLSWQPRMAESLAKAIADWSKS